MMTIIADGMNNKTSRTVKACQVAWEKFNHSKTQDRIDDCNNTYPKCARTNECRRGGEKKKHEKGKEEKAGKKRRKNTENKNDSKTNFRNPRGTF
jgi:hypothetical protein